MTRAPFIPFRTTIGDTPAVASAHVTTTAAVNPVSNVPQVAVDSVTFLGDALPTKEREAIPRVSAIPGVRRSIIRDGVVAVAGDVPGGSTPTGPVDKTKFWRSDRMWATPFTLSGPASYLTFANLQLTCNAVNVTTDVSGILAVVNGGTGKDNAVEAFTALKQAATTTASGVVTLAANREIAVNKVVQSNDGRINRTVFQQRGTDVDSAATDVNEWKRWTDNNPKTYTIKVDTHAANNELRGINIGTADLTIVAEGGVTLVGDLVVPQGQWYAIIFSTKNKADIIG